MAPARPGLDAPADGQPAGRRRERPMLACVPGKFVQDEGELDGEPRLDQGRGPFERHPVAPPAQPVRGRGSDLQRVCDQDIDRHPGHLARDEAVVHAGERLDPAAEARDEGLEARRPPERLSGDRLDRRERVLHAVVQLLDQLPLQRLGPSAGGDVAGDLGGADHPSAGIPDRRDGERDRDAPPVPGQTLGIERRHRLAPAQARDDGGFFGQKLGRNDPGDRLADHLLGAPAEDADGPGVPGGDPPVEPLADDRVIRPGDDCGQPRRGQVGRLPRRLGLHHQLEHARHPPPGLAQEARAGEEGDPASVGPLGVEDVGRRRGLSVAEQAGGGRALGRKFRPPAVEQAPGSGPAGFRPDRAPPPESHRRGIAPDHPPRRIGREGGDGKHIEEVEAVGFCPRRAAGTGRGGCHGAPGREGQGGG